MQPKPPDVRQSLSLKHTLPHVWPPGEGVGAGAGPDKYFAMQLNCAQSLYLDADATLDDLREAVTTLDEIVRIARRVLGKSNPLPGTIEAVLRDAQAALRARETPSQNA